MERVSGQQVGEVVGGSHAEEIEEEEEEAWNYENCRGIGAGSFVKIFNTLVFLGNKQHTVDQAGASWTRSGDDDQRF